MLSRASGLEPVHEGLWLELVNLWFTYDNLKV